MMLTDNVEFADDISVLISDDGSWPDMPIIDTEDSCLSGKSSADTSLASTLVEEPYYYTLLPDDVNDKTSRRLQCLLTPPTPVARENPSPAFVNLPPRSRCDFDSEPFDTPHPSPMPFQSKWIHRRLWAHDDKQGDDSRRNSLLGSVMPRSWSKADRAARIVCPEKPTTDRVISIAHLSRPPLARSSSVSPSITSSLASSRTAGKPTKSILSSRASISTKASKLTRSRSGTAPSVKFADAPTYYYDYEYKYSYGHREVPECEGVEAYESQPPSPAPPSTTPCVSSPRKSAAAATTARANKVRQALGRLIPSAARKSADRPSVSFISGPYPLWKDNDNGSIRSGRSIPSSVRSAPASQSRVKTFWGRMMACTL